MKKLIEKIKITSKTKKIILAAVAAVLLIASVLTIVLCTTLSMHPIERFAAKVARKQNFQMDVVLSGIPIFGAVALTCEVDGNIQHVPDATFISEFYTETVGDKQYTYSKDANGNWTKTESAENMLSKLKDNEMLEKLIDPDSYEPVEGKENVYRQKDDVEFENCKNVTLTIEKDSCTIEMILYTDGMALETLIVISNIGKMDVELPTVD